MKFAYKRFASGIERPIIPIIVRSPPTQQRVLVKSTVNVIANTTIEWMT